MEFTVFIRKQVTVEIKEYPDKPPLIVGTVDKPQILINTDKATVTIIETK